MTTPTPKPQPPTANPSATAADDFLYDDLGNRTKCYLKSADATTYLANTVNEYTKSTLSGTDTFYGHDAAGNLTRIAAAVGSDTDGDWRYYYDYESFLTKAEKYVTDAWVTQGEYVRDALGRRVEKVADGTTIRYYYDGMRAIEETEGTASPTVERQYVFGNGIDEALVLFKKNGANYDAYYYLADPLWTVEALVDEDAAIVEAYAYRAYGEPTIKTADGGDGDWFDGDETTATASAFGNTIMFTGRQYDPETGNYYYRARIYDPLRGRFTSRDPIGYHDGMSLYLGYFVPRDTDPSGMACCKYLWKPVNKTVTYKLGPNWGDFAKQEGKKVLITALVFLVTHIVEKGGGSFPGILPVLPSEFTRFHASVKAQIIGRWNCTRQCLNPKGPVVTLPFVMTKVLTTTMLGKGNIRCMLTPGSADDVMRDMLDCASAMREHLIRALHEIRQRGFTATCP